MLIEQGASVYGQPLDYENHVEPLVNQFYEFDRDDSGFLDREDLIEAIATKRAEKHYNSKSRKDLAELHDPGRREGTRLNP